MKGSTWREMKLVDGSEAIRGGRVVRILRKRKVRNNGTREMEQGKGRS
jgi:hypothetical protein